MVEKDMIQSMFLRSLSLSDVDLVFKGGTSLSKCFGLIERFSEDLDLSMERKPTEAEKKHVYTTIMSIAADLGLDLLNPESVMSRHNYNKYVFGYESLFAGSSLNIIVETSFYQEVYPVVIHKVDSFVGSFCAEREITLPIPFETESFNMPVQTLERTFIDKVFAICDYKIQGVQEGKSRHLYDIYKLLPKVSFSSELRELIDKVRKDRRSSKNNPSSQLSYDIPKLLGEIIDSRYFEEDYNTVTKKLLYENINYEEAITEGIANVIEACIF